MTILYLILGAVVLFFLIQFALAALVILVPVGLVLFVIYYFKHRNEFTDSKPYEAQYTETVERNDYPQIDVIDATYSEKEEMNQ